MHYKVELLERKHFLGFIIQGYYYKNINVQQVLKDKTVYHTLQYS